MMTSGAISLLNGMFPAMKITEPYSPTARAKARAKPEITAGRSAGRTTETARRRAPAPSVVAASSTSRSRSSSTGCTERTTNGRPTNTIATQTPTGV